MLSKKNERKYQPLLHHFEYLKNLGEVRDEDDDDVAHLGVGRTMNVDLNSAKAASNGADEERELMLLEAAEHVKMARAQRALYKAKVADAVADEVKA